MTRHADNRLAAAVLAGLLLTGCTTSSTNGGPLLVGADSSTVCAIQPEHGNAAYGNVVRNGGDSPLIFKAVSLVEAENLEIESASIMPIEGDFPYVLGTGSTEPDDPVAQAAWQQAQSVEAYEIEPGHAVNVIVALDKADPNTGTTRALRIDYKQGDDHFFVETNMKISLADDACF